METQGEVRNGTYEEVRAVCLEFGNGLGLIAFVTVSAFFVYQIFIGPISLGWLWIPQLIIANILAPLAVGIPVILLRVGMEIRRPTIGFGWFMALKFSMLIWSLISFFVAWRIAAMAADWMS